MEFEYSWDRVSQYQVGFIGAERISMGMVGEGTAIRHVVYHSYPNTSFTYSYERNDPK